jgi:hypothetical protein
MFLEKLRKTTLNLYQDTLCPGQDSNWAPPEYNSEIKTTRKVTR